MSQKVTRVAENGNKVKNWIYIGRKTVLTERSKNIESDHISTGLYSRYPAIATQKTVD